MIWPVRIDLYRAPFALIANHLIWRLRVNYQSGLARSIYVVKHPRNADPMSTANKLISLFNFRCSGSWLGHLTDPSYPSSCPAIPTSNEGNVLNLFDVLFPCSEPLHSAKVKATFFKRCSVKGLSLFSIMLLHLRKLIVIHKLRRNSLCCSAEDYWTHRPRLGLRPHIKTNLQSLTD